MVGIGGCGVNTVTLMTSSQAHFTYIGIDRDWNSLRSSVVDLAILLDQGLAFPNIIPLLTKSDIVAIAAGMGGETGAEMAPVLARAARAHGATVIGVVSMPFRFEGYLRRRYAVTRARKLQEITHQLKVVELQDLVEQVPRSTSMKEAFRRSCRWLAGELHSDIEDVLQNSLPPSEAPFSGKRCA
ncbi:MAG: hypothetical protein HN348_22650 [Proteobacteria bacterium]|nr:hypothetical protein [Pseudomonadota bacterium]